MVSLVPAAAVIAAPVSYIKVVAVKRLMVCVESCAISLSAFLLCTKDVRIQPRNVKETSTDYINIFEI